MATLRLSSTLRAAAGLRATEVKPFRRARAELIAAFLLGGLIALLIAAPGHAAEASRLDRLAIVRFSPTPDGRLLRQEGVLDLAGDTAWHGTQNIARAANAQEWALNRALVNVNLWRAFHKLGGNATANFELLGGAVHVPFGKQVYSVPEDVFD